MKSWSMIVILSLLFVVFVPGFSQSAEKVAKLGHVLDTKHPYHIGSEFFAKEYKDSHPW